MMLAGAQIVDSGSVAYKPSNESGSVSVLPPQAPGPSPSAPAPAAPPAPPGQMLARVPNKEPVDMHFSNITCTVKLGINKGKNTKNCESFYASNFIVVLISGVYFV
ncbi:hypothetical protein O0L34_g11321 [Tuta absoluta]|nr:hypothetical protein O0L34_g11321 [Tuta absoluta]